MEIAQPLLDKDSSSEFERKPRVEKLRYFYKASWFSKLFFNWIVELISYGNRHTIVQENLEDLKMSDRAEVVYENWSSVWNTYKNTDKVAPLQNSLKKAFAMRFVYGMIMDFLTCTFMMLTPVLIYFISVYLVDKTKTLGIGFFYLGIVVLVRFFRSFFDAHCGYSFLLLGSDIANSLSLGMVNKALSFSVLCNKKFKMGELANLMQVDCARLLLFPKNFSAVIFFLYSIVFAIVFMSLIIGPAFLAGFAVTLVAGLINVFISRFTARFQANLATETDNRMKISNEIFNNIKFIKVNAWEEYFYDKLEAKRKEELGWVKKKFMTESILTFLMWLAPKMILVATFATFVLSTGLALTPPVAFTVVSLFSYLQFILQFLPNSISITIDGFNAFKRIEKFLLAEELNRTFLTHNKFDLSEEREAISIENGNFYWDRDDRENAQAVSIESCHLIDLNVSINKGEFVAIVGDIGTGKSSFLYSLLGELKFPDVGTRPKVKISGSMSLVTQKPWIVNETVRNNILFGKEFNRKKYEEVIYYASLKRDMELFTHGDKTMIGEKGATLSGGQKARISFARALYSDSDILLLDDLLSAVDVHVGKFILKETLLKYCKEKTVLLVTHAIYYLKYVDKILIMDNGRIVEQGSFDKLKNSVRFREILALLMDKSDDPVKKKSVDLINLQEEEEDNEEEIVVQPVRPAKPEEKKEEEEEEKPSGKVERSLSTISHTQELANKAEANKVIADPVINELMISEETGVGEIPWSLYKSYLDFNGGTIFIVGILFAKTGWLFLNTIFNIWLTFWTENSLDKDDQFYINWYLSIGVAYGIFAFFRAFIFSFSNVRMSKHMHKEMISNLLFSSLNEFFDRVPLGRILNRLSKDLNVVDANFPSVTGNVLVFLFFLIGNTIIIVYCSTVWVLFPILIYVVCCYYLKNYYMKPQRELVRLESNTKSPIISCFTEILNGVATIRAYGVENSFFMKNCQKINQNKKPQTARKAVEVWFTLRLTFLSFIVNIGALSFVLFKDIPVPARACLLLAMALGFDELTYYYIMNLSNFENELISFERCSSFMHLTPEPGYVEYLKNRELLKIKNKERRQQGKSRFVGLWPERGEIKFIDFFVKYRPNLDPVLRGLSVTFAAGEKIGVVGRTGSGKSTIMMSLLRILESFKGQILIDGKDIAKMSLDDLRSAITIILQDPCLFAGTLRENLDPLGEYSDDDLNKSLEECALLETMAERKGLLTDITENGENLSVGERQLISIARAILKPSKIVLIDEATANIDIRTEGIIYKAMNNAFRNSTVITIAHRLNTVINSDKILVLEGGQLKEYDHPQVLLRNPESFFAQLYNQSQKENKV